jgi:hypothetical protein
MSRADKQAFKNKRVLLLGASVGYEWDLPKLPERTQNNNYSFEMIPVYAFDKSDALNEILMRPKRKFRFNRSYIKSLLKPALQKPEVLIIKECAAYFPGDFEKYKTLVKQWVAQCKVAGIQPVLATVVSVTNEHSQRKPGRLEGILEYNDWARSYTREAGINCFDLEAALRISENNRKLRQDLTIGDGLHLNAKAYSILDKLVLEYLDKYTK